MSFYSPDHSNHTARSNDAFVDDTTGGVNDTHLSTPLSPTDLAALLHKTQLWGVSSSHPAADSNFPNSF
jgi:hypothetical protein